MHSVSDFLTPFSLTVCLAACSIGRQQPQLLSPPDPGKGEPIYFPADFDSKPWVYKTQPQRIQTWFKFLPSGEWRIDWDAERKPFDLIVIHHTSGSPTASAEEIESLHKQYLYEVRYNSKDVDPYVVGLPIHSGHIVSHEETFMAYHHLIYEDGNMTTELAPLIEIDGQWYVDMVAWHAGNWDANCRSVAICLVGDYTTKEPTIKQIGRLQRLVKRYRQFNPDLKVEPHKKFNPSKTCPGAWWDKWGKKDLQ